MMGRYTEQIQLGALALENLAQLREAIHLFIDRSRDRRLRLQSPYTILDRPLKPEADSRTCSNADYLCLYRIIVYS